VHGFLDVNFLVSKKPYGIKLNYNIMKKIFSIIFISFFVLFNTTTLVAQKDSSNIYKTIKKDVKDVTKGVASDVEDMFSSSPDSSYKNVADSSKITFSKVYGDVRAGIVGMAKALKIGAEHVYYVLIRQQLAKSIMWLVMWIVTIILLRMAWKTSNVKNWKNTKKDDEDFPSPKNGYAVLNAFFWVIGSICLIVCVCYIPTMIYGFVNPEYGAMKDIVNFVKDIRGN